MSTLLSSARKGADWLLKRMEGEDAQIARVQVLLANAGDNPANREALDELDRRMADATRADWLALARLLPKEEASGSFRNGQVNLLAMARLSDGAFAQRMAVLRGADTFARINQLCDQLGDRIATIDAQRQVESDARVAAYQQLYH